MNRPEEDLQRSIVDWLEWNRPRWRRRMVYFAVPNQRGTRSRTENQILKALGVRPGVSDLVFIYEGSRALFVELKAPGREARLSEAQQEFCEDCTRLHAPYYVASSLEEVQELLERYELLEPRRRGRDGQAELPG